MVWHWFNVLMLRKVKHSVTLQLTIKKNMSQCFSVAHTVADVEADTRMILNALNFDTKFREMGKSGRTIIRTSNTNVIVLCVHYYKHMTHTSELWLQMGNISSVKDGRRFLPIHQLCACLSPTICKLLPAVHALTGCDTTSSLFGVGKQTVYKTLKDTHDYFSGLQSFGNIDKDEALVWA
ncbi:unnamed protein product [Mytilus coruscus]|uniref:Uncharacterized protein n=1 Tax=Mytilus coruscus TaxID=42192 RepID=A0A6J8CM21_MYTCO|nr:unnamed protein product [Mytilus coruscus]